MKEKYMKQNKSDKRASFYGFEEQLRVPVSYVPYKCGTFTVDIYDYIESPTQFADMIDALNLMEQDDEMIVNLQSGGGCLSTTDTILHAMRKTKGKVHFVATGFNASAATILLLDAPSFELSEDFSALIHCGSLSDGGNFNEYRQSAGFHIKRMENLLRNTYAGFLTEDEIDSMLDGKDILLDAQQWCERHEQRNQWLQDQVNKLEEAALNALKPTKKPRKKKVNKDAPTTENKTLVEPLNDSFKGLETAFDTKPE